MRIQTIINVLSTLLLFLCSTMLVPLIIAIVEQQSDLIPFILSFIITLITGSSLFFLTKKTKKDISHREGFAIVSFGWFLCCIFGALPFYFHGSFGGITNCVFESTSGFTTTGSTILKEIENLPSGILFWRSLTHWLGGMGIIVLSLAILPLLGVGGMQLFKAEVPGPVTDKLRPRIGETAKLLWKVYVAISVIEATLLYFGGMSLYDAVCHTFGTMATGGFSTMNKSIEHYNSVYIDTVITIFMLIAGTNFSLHYTLWKGKYKSYLRDTEFKLYFSVFACFTILITSILYFGNFYPTLGEAIRKSSFQVASILTTTGFSTADFSKWTNVNWLAPSLLFMLMFLGGSAGSTSGGIKCIRAYLLIKIGYRELYKLIHPHAIVQVKLAGKVIDESILRSITGFFVLFMSLFIISGLILTAMGLDFITAFSAVIASLGNIGPGLGGVGPAENYSHIPYLGKWLLIFCMLLGRLEIFTILVLLVPEYWRR